MANTNVTLSKMKGSKYHKIVAAVLEVMESALTEPQQDVNLQESGTPDVWKMVFVKSSTTLDELVKIKNQLGKNFGVEVVARDKSSISVIVMAPNSDFLLLIGEKPEPQSFSPQPSFGGGSNTPGIKPEGEQKP